MIKGQPVMIVTYTYIQMSKLFLPFLFFYASLKLFF